MFISILLHHQHGSVIQCSRRQFSYIERDSTTRIIGYHLQLTQLTALTFPTIQTD